MNKQRTSRKTGTKQQPQNKSSSSDARTFTVRSNLIPGGKRTKLTAKQPTMRQRRKKLTTERKTSPMQNSVKRPGANRKAVSAEQIQKRLKRKSPWYASIMDPLANAEVKIPDETGLETGTLQVVTRVAITATANGLACLRIICPYVNSGPLGDSNGYNYQVADVTSTSNNVIWSDGATPGNAVGFEDAAAIKDFSQGIRVVSASVALQPEMSSLNDQGEMISFIAPFLNSPGGSPTTMAQMYGSSITPVNTKHAAIARWVPYAYEKYDYKQFMDPYETQVGIGGTTPPWTLGVVAHGLQTGAAVSGLIVVNYEFLPELNVANIVQSSPSPTDTMESELVLNWVQDAPVTGTVPTREISRSPSAAKLNHDDDVSGFGMFFNVLEELAPIAMGALSLL
jgi:hypothetical protein